MGTAKYPDENDFSEFTTKNGGSSNAYTECEATVFAFDINPKFLREALDRFAQFFVAPLMKQGSMEREAEAVDSEFKQALQNDSVRVGQMHCSLAKKGHVYNSFGWGNKKSLFEVPQKSGLDLNAELHAFHDKYC